MMACLTPEDEFARLRANPEAVALFDHLAETARLSWHQGLTRDQESYLEGRVGEQQGRLLACGAPTADLLRAAAALRAEVEVVRLGRRVEML